MIDDIETTLRTTPDAPAEMVKWGHSLGFAKRALLRRRKRGPTSDPCWCIYQRGDHGPDCAEIRREVFGL